MTESEILQTLPPLKGAELDAAYHAIIEEKGVDPITADRFLDVDTEHIGLSSVDRYVPAALLAGYVATWAVNHVGGTLPVPGVMPEQLDAVLQAIHAIGNNAANSPAIRDHLPYLLLEASAAWGAIKTLPNFLKLKTKRGKIAKTQTETAARMSEGEFTFTMAEGHTAAFVGRGDRTASLLQDVKPADQVMLYAHAQINSDVYQKIRELGLQEDLFHSFDRGNLGAAGEIVLFPIKDEDMFLPGEDDGHDMTLDEIEAIVDLCDDYCDSRKIPRKRVVIVGRKTMKETYTRRTGKNKVTENTTTLNDLVERLQQERKGIPTEIFDPTEIVMQRIATLAEGRKLEFAATKESDQRYGGRFYRALEEVGYKPTSQQSISVRYNIQDTPTEVAVDIDDIAVILDPSRKQSFLNRGISEENILVVPEIIQQTLSTEVDKS